jgi:hypothetical protein
MSACGSAPFFVATKVKSQCRLDSIRCRRGLCRDDLILDIVREYRSMAVSAGFAASVARPDAGLIGETQALMSLQRMLHLTLHAISVS